MRLARNGVAKRKAKPKPPQYKVWLRPAVHASRKQLPGQIRQRIKRMIDDLEQNPHPAESEALELPDDITIQKRPPYDYEDLESLLSEL